MGTLIGRPEPPDRFINRMISEHCVVVFAKTHCPYSQMAKDIFKLLQVPIKAIDIDLRSDGDSIQETLKTMTRVRTVTYIGIRRIFYRRSLDTVKPLGFSGETEIG